MRLFPLFLATGVAACAQPETADGFRDITGQRRGQAQLERSIDKCHYDMSRMSAQGVLVGGPVLMPGPGPRLYYDCMRAEGWALVERTPVSGR